MRRSPAAALALASLLLAGCHGKPAPSAALGSTAPRPSTTTGSPARAAELSTDVARKPRADELKVLTTIPGMSGRTRQGVLALSPLGQALVGVQPKPATGDLIAQSRLAVIGGGKRSWLPATIKEARPRQTFDGTMPDGSTAAWMETRSTDLFDIDWKVFGWSHGGVRLLADSDTFARGHPLPPAAGGDHLMTSDGKNVWWSFRKAGTDLPIATNIATVELAGGPPRVVVKGGDLPTVDPRGGLVYVRDPYTAPHSVGYELHLLRGTRDEVLHRGTTGSVGFISALCVGRDVVAWAVPAETDDPGGQIEALNRATGDVQTIRLKDSARGPDLVCGDGFVAWGNGSGNGDAGQYLWSLKTGSLVKLGESFGISGVMAAGPYVAWTLPPASPQAPANTRLARWDGG
jgi:hypothetical protein